MPVRTNYPQEHMYQEQIAMRTIYRNSFMLLSALLITSILTINIRIFLLVKKPCLILVRMEINHAINASVIAWLLGLPCNLKNSNNPNNQLIY